MRFDAASAQCLVFTRAEGVLSAVAHDLKIRVERFTAVMDDGTGAITAELDAASLRVVCAMRGGADAPGVLGDGDLQTIAATIGRDVLEVDRHPTIRFRSTAIVAASDGGGESADAALRIDGTLELHGVAGAIALHAARQGGCYVAETTLHQPDFGIRPYSAMLGALRVAADVRVRVVIPLG